jgi:hypothetical protein
LFIGYESVQRILAPVAISFNEAIAIDSISTECAPAAIHRSGVRGRPASTRAAARSHDQ